MAGAGTGKTTTLCARVAWLVKQGVAPERIMLLTFTRRAAREMLQRTRALVPIPAGNGGVLGGTFHSVAHRFVRMHAASVGLAPGFAVLDPGDAADLLDLLREEHGHAQSQRRFPARARFSTSTRARSTFSDRCRRSALRSVPMVRGARRGDGDTFQDLHGPQDDQLGVLDLDDLLIYWRALAADEVIGRAIEEAFDHVLVDEYQDVQRPPGRDRPRDPPRLRRGLTVVGDDFQAIYGWRSASADYILEFPSHFPDATVVTLERNYRSTQPILDTANELAAQATRAYEKRLRTELEGGGRPELLWSRDESEQAHEVCERVLRRGSRGSICATRPC